MAKCKTATVWNTVISTSLRGLKSLLKVSRKLQGDNRPPAKRTEQPWDETSPCLSIPSRRIIFPRIYKNFLNTFASSTNKKES